MVKDTDMWYYNTKNLEKILYDNKKKIDKENQTKYIK